MFTHLLERVGRGVPGVLVWSLCYFMIHGLGVIANGLIAAACGAYIIMLMSDLTLARHLNVNRIIENAVKNTITSKHKAIWNEKLAIYQKSLWSFFRNNPSIMIIAIYVQVYPYTL